jgi:lipid A ethanolaminephosphotransferase
MSCLEARSHDAISHDNLYHTVLGALAVRNAVYEPGLDVLAQCRSALPQSHE